jgi:hypothetical protein
VENKEQTFGFEVSGEGKARTLFTITQWKSLGRIVDVATRDEAAAKRVLNNGVTIYLYSYLQTRAIDEGMSQKIGKDCGLAPWEVEHGFSADGTQRQSPDNHYSRSQWRARNRMVKVTDAEAVRVIETRTGHKLYLFSFEQTLERKK